MSVLKGDQIPVQGWSGVGVIDTSLSQTPNLRRNTLTQKPNHGFFTCELPDETDNFLWFQFLRSIENNRRVRDGEALHRIHIAPNARILVLDSDESFDELCQRVGRHSAEQSDTQSLTWASLQSMNICDGILVTQSAARSEKLALRWDFEQILWLNLCFEKIERLGAVKHGWRI